MKRIAALIMWSGLCMPLWGMPSQITFQGTLKQKNVPVNGTRNMQFSFVDSSGASIPGTSPISIANVQVTNGLFAVQLPIDPNIPWEQYSPFIQVSIEGQILAPNQPLNANLYAISAIPQGMVALFASSCPTGWSEFTALRGRFPVGYDPGNPGQFTMGQQGGALTHNHTAGQNSFVGYGPYCSSFGMDGYGGGCGAVGADTSHGHTISFSSSLPPYKTIVFCSKD